MNKVIESLSIPSCITVGIVLIATGGGGGGGAAAVCIGWEGGAGGACGIIGWADCCWSLETTGPLLSVDGKSFDEYSNP